MERYLKPSWQGTYLFGELMSPEARLKAGVAVTVEDSVTSWLRTLKPPPAYPAYNNREGKVEIWLVGKCLGSIQVSQLISAGNWRLRYEDFEKDCLGIN